MKIEKTVMSFRATKLLSAAIKKAALKERRPVAHWIELTLEAALIEQGFIDPSDTES